MDQMMKNLKDEVVEGLEADFEENEEGEQFEDSNINSDTVFEQQWA